MTKITMEGGEYQIAVNVPLFLKKLWKMVNDKEAEDIIGWNTTGDGFVIHDQLQFITKLLPQYFKHNNLASFIRQLNFYDFHKVASIDKDEIQFTHSCFLKDIPETLYFIKRKCTTFKSKMTNNANEEEINELLDGVKELKSKHSQVDNELKLLKQENATLWSEINSLRVKHSKQTKLINKIIHFLISYMHSHQSSLSKRNASVARKPNQKNLKTGPTILELDYHNTTDQQKEDTHKSKPTVVEHSESLMFETPNTEVHVPSPSPVVTHGYKRLYEETQQEQSSADSFYTFKSEKPNGSQDKCTSSKQNPLQNITKYNMLDKPSTSDKNLETVTEFNPLHKPIEDYGLYSSEAQVSLPAENTIKYETGKKSVPQSKNTIIYEKGGKSVPQSKAQKGNVDSENYSIYSSDDKVLLPSKNAVKYEQGKPSVTQSKLQKGKLGFYKPDLEKPCNILENPKENLGLYVDSTELELNSLQDILGNLNAVDLDNFCHLIENTETDSSGVSESTVDLENICDALEDGNYTLEDKTKFMKKAGLGDYISSNTNAEFETDEGNAENYEELTDKDSEHNVDKYFNTEY